MEEAIGLANIVSSEKALLDRTLVLHTEICAPQLF